MTSFLTVIAVLWGGCVVLLLTVVVYELEWVGRRVDGFLSMEEQAEEIRGLPEAEPRRVVS